MPTRKMRIGTDKDKTSFFKGYIDDFVLLSADKFNTGRLKNRQPDFTLRDESIIWLRMGDDLGDRISPSNSISSRNIIKNQVSDQPHAIPKDFKKIEPNPKKNDPGIYQTAVFTDQAKEQFYDSKRRKCFNKCKDGTVWASNSGKCVNINKPNSCPQGWKFHKWKRKCIKSR